VHVRESADRGAAVVLVHGVIVSSRCLMPLGVELAGTHHVVVPDLPGYGLDNSFGAQVVAEAAVRHPDRVARIALLGPTVDPGARTLLRQYARWQRGALVEHPSSIAVLARDAADVGVLRAARLLRVMLADAIEDKLPAVSRAALVLRGDRDRVAPAEWSRHAARLLPHGRLATVPGCGHMAHYSAPLAVAAVLQDFLAARPA
jgi:pimeloyl-ACP methyl ester carboxylesterase